MDPRSLFPLLALLFFGLAAWKRWRSGHWRAPASTWALLGLIFGAVATWLRFAG